MCWFLGKGLAVFVCVFTSAAVCSEPSALSLSSLSASLSFFSKSQSSVVAIRERRSAGSKSPQTWWVLQFRCNHTTRGCFLNNSLIWLLFCFCCLPASVSSKICQVMNEVYFLKNTLARISLKVLSLKTVSNAWIVRQERLIPNTRSEHTHTAKHNLTHSLQSSSATQLCDLIKYLAGPCGWPFHPCLTLLLCEQPTARNQATLPLMRSEVWPLSSSQA